MGERERERQQDGGVMGRGYEAEGGRVESREDVRRE